MRPFAGAAHDSGGVTETEMELNIRDMLNGALVVAPDSCPGQVSQGGQREDRVFAVFGNPQYPNRANYLGLVPWSAAKTHANSPFRDLVRPAENPAISAESPPDEIATLLGKQRHGMLAVFNTDSRFLGILTSYSLFMILLRAVFGEEEKARAYRKNVQKDKERRALLLERMQKLNGSFRKLMTLLARPGGPEIFQQGIEALAVLLEADYGAVALVNDRGTLKESIFTGGSADDSSDPIQFADQRRALTETVVREASVLRVERVTQHLTNIGVDVAKPTMRSFLGVPISREGQCFGCVSLCNKINSEPFTDEDELLASSYAQTLALIISQARDREERKRAAQERESLAALGISLASADTLERLGAVLRDATFDFWSWDMFSLSVCRFGHSRLDPILNVRNAKGVLQPIDAERTSDLVPDSILDELRTGPGSLLLRSESQDHAGADFARDFACSVYAGVRQDSAIIGTLSIHSSSADQYQERDRVFLQRIAEMIGPAVARCEAERWSRMFASLGFQLSTVRTPLEAANVIIAAADDLMGWDSCSVYLIHPESGLGEDILHMDIIDGKRVTYSNNSAPGTLGEMAKKTIQDGAQMVLRESAELTHGLRTFGDHGRYSLSLMFVPIRSGSGITGVMSIQSYTRNAYTRRDLEMLQGLADHCAGAFDRTRLDEFFKQAGVPLKKPISRKPKAKSDSPRTGGRKRA